MSHLQRPNTKLNAHHSPADPTPPIGLRVVKGALMPATESDHQTLQRLDLSMNQVVHVQLDTLRHPSDLKRIHKLGQLLVEHVDMFAHMDSHQAVKVLQSLSGAGCDVVSLPAGTLADLAGQPCQGNPDKLVVVFQPWSLSPNALSGAQFARLFDQLCRYVALEIWPHCEQEQIAKWADITPYSLP